jgi:antibiotic biosynthesis monooxygenase (ABM) superfamily enzyme
MDNEMPSTIVSEGVTVVVNRQIKLGREAEFEQAMRNFVQFALGFPGHRGISILRPAAGRRDYIVVDKFADERARVNFKASAEYQEWMNRLGELTEGDPRIEELTGLEGWFTLPEDTGLAKPPTYKMAIATFLGVFPVVMLLSLTLGPVVRAWPFVINNAVFNACVVILLTWVVMPLVTRALRHWLFPEKD